jgi:low affinity Fe/Cu permease
MNKTQGFFERFAKLATSWSGSSAAFALAVTTVVVWASTGPLFDFSETWQLVINTGTTIVTFLMVFLIQRTQNKDSLAIHLKLNELVAAVNGASNRLIDAEDMCEEELTTLGRHYQHLVQLAESDGSLTESHSVEEARDRHARKSGSGDAPRGARAARGTPAPERLSPATPPPPCGHRA